MVSRVARRTIEALRSIYFLLVKNSCRLSVVCCQNQIGQLTTDNRQRKRGAVAPLCNFGYALFAWTWISTRRFNWRPVVVLLVARGCDLPDPIVLTREPLTPRFSR